VYIATVVETFYLLLLMILSACSSINIKKEITDGIFEKVTGKEISRNVSQSPELKRQCVRGNYEKWIQRDGFVLPNFAWSNQI
jgi:hypothetical protein